MKRYLVLLLLLSFCGGSSATITDESSDVEDSSTTTSTLPDIMPTVQITCGPVMSDQEGFMTFNFEVKTGTNELVVLNIVSWFDSSRTDDLFISDGLPVPGSSNEFEYTVDNSFSQYEIEMVVMDSKDNFANDYCLYQNSNSSSTTTILDNSNDYSKSYLSNYTLYDQEFGTSVEVTVANKVRTIVSNAIPNHRTGRFPNSGNPHTITEQNKIWNFPLNGVYTGTPKDVREPGVALNGVKFEPGTAETVSCNSSEVYSVEGLQQDYPLGMDINNAHVQPSGEYHYHGVSQLLIDVFSNENDLVLIGFAQDGFLIYYSKSNNYKSSYQLSSAPRKGTNCTVSLRNQQELDLEGTIPNGTYTEDWNFVANSGELDECNGAFIDNQYAYVITNEYPYFPRCLMGEFTEQSKGRERRP